MVGLDGGKGEEPPSGRLRGEGAARQFFLLPMKTIILPKGV
jgi:hypothetical protein